MKNILIIILFYWCEEAIAQPILGLKQTIHGMMVYPDTNSHYIYYYSPKKLEIYDAHFLLMRDEKQIVQHYLIQFKLKLKHYEGSELNLLREKLSNQQHNNIELRNLPIEIELDLFFLGKQLAQSITVENASWSEQHITLFLTQNEAQLAKAILSNKKQNILKVAYSWIAIGLDTASKTIEKRVVFSDALPLEIEPSNIQTFDMTHDIYYPVLEVLCYDFVNDSPLDAIRIEVEATGASNEVQRKTLTFSTAKPSKQIIYFDNAVKINKYFKYRVIHYHKNGSIQKSVWFKQPFFRRLDISTPK